MEAFVSVCLKLITFITVNVLITLSVLHISKYCSCQKSEVGKHYVVSVQWSAVKKIKTVIENVIIKSTVLLKSKFFKVCKCLKTVLFSCCDMMPESWNRQVREVLQ